MSDDQLKKIVKEVIAEMGINDMSGMGKVMGSVMKRAEGQADGNKVREFVTQLLSKQ